MTYQIQMLFFNCYYVFAQDDTEVTVVWASLTTCDADSVLLKHDTKGILSGKHNLIKEAMSAMQPDATPPIPTESVGVIGAHFSFYIVLTCLSVHVFVSQYA